ncbi:prolyl oligopeptidase family serine peptidase [Candidatus Roizmanbacteria bacterium]|nr:prolyl oligopeptidase family serine peptidase [Candidatus Roizmanbacteria bacterium]
MANEIDSPKITENISLPLAEASFAEFTQKSKPAIEKFNERYSEYLGQTTLKGVETHGSNKFAKVRAQGDSEDALYLLNGDSGKVVFDIKRIREKFSDNSVNISRDPVVSPDGKYIAVTLMKKSTMDGRNESFVYLYEASPKEGDEADEILFPSAFYSSLIFTEEAGKTTGFIFNQYTKIDQNTGKKVLQELDPVGDKLYNNRTFQYYDFKNKTQTELENPGTDKWVDYHKAGNNYMIRYETLRGKNVPKVEISAFSSSHFQADWKELNIDLPVGASFIFAENNNQDLLMYRTRQGEVRSASLHDLSHEEGLKWQTLVEPAKDLSLVSIDRMGENSIALRYTHAGTSTVSILDLNTKQLYTLPYSGEGTISNVQYLNNGVISYTFETLVDEPTIYMYDIHDHKLKKVEVVTDAQANAEKPHVSVKSVKMNREDYVRNALDPELKGLPPPPEQSTVYYAYIPATNPSGVTLLIDYSAYGAILNTTYNPVLKTLAELGVNVAISMASGGGYKGAESHEDGMGQRKVSRTIPEIRQIVRKLKNEQDKVVGYGHSGGAWALLVSALHEADPSVQFDGLVMTGPVINPAEHAGSIAEFGYDTPKTAEVVDQVGPIASLHNPPKNIPPMIAIVGDADNNVNPELQINTFIQAATRAGLPNLVELQRVPKANHGVAGNIELSETGAIIYALCDAVSNNDNAHL